MSAGATGAARRGTGTPGSLPVELATRLLAGRTGLRVTEGLRERLAACLDGVARAAGRTPEAYAAGLAGDPDAFQALLDCVTVQESGFFRHPEQFAALGREVLGALEGPVVVWSAGCGNGQEAYSLAMELAASGRSDWEVLATDISAAAVARARAGRYSTAELAGLPPAHRHRLRPAGDRWEVDPALRRRVRVERADLTTHLPAPPGRCQVVFCRNVLIYLTREAARSFLDRLAAWLAPGGLVFLGYSEAVLPPTARLTVERVGPAHALRVAPDPAGTGGAGGLWTTRDIRSPGRLRSPTAVEELEAGAGAVGRGDLPAAVAASRRAAPGPSSRVGRPVGPGRDRSGQGGPGTTVVAFRSGGRDWAVALERVRRVLAARGLVPFPDPRPGVAGLLHLDGGTVPVVALLGAAGGQVLVLDGDGDGVGLLVDEVVGIQRVEGQAGPSPAGQRSPLVAGVVGRERPLLLLDVAALTGWLGP